MKLQIVSDLHYNWKYIPTGADALLIAGDFGNGLGELVGLMGRITDIPVYFVLGNHDYYNEVTQDVVPLVKRLCEQLAPNWHLLDNDIATINDMRIIGTTLWTNLGGPNEQWFVKQAIKQWPDFRCTKWVEEDGTIRNKVPEDLIGQFNEAEKFLKFAINEPFDGKTVVMTHFVPVKDKCTHPRFGKDVANHYFCNDLEYLMGKDMLWIAGHTHDRYDIMLGDTRLVIHPVGYGNENDKVPDLIVEI